jgi:hypothetical protein
LRQQRVDARKRAIAAHRERKADTRRKIVIGTLILDRIQRGEFDQAQLLGWLDQTLSRADDRALFQLPPKPRETGDPKIASISPEAAAVPAASSAA